jgi:hypothetical protein
MHAGAGLQSGGTSGRVLAVALIRRHVTLHAGCPRVIAMMRASGVPSRVLRVRLAGIRSQLGKSSLIQGERDMVRSVDGFWISAEVFIGDFSNSYYQFFDPPGPDVYATISLSQLNHSPTEPDLERRASAFIEEWVTYDADGKLVGPDPNSTGANQNAVYVRNCAAIGFRLDVSNWVSAIAQINIFQF